jgi:hypothetical protein
MELNLTPVPNARGGPATRSAAIRTGVIERKRPACLNGEKEDEAVIRGATLAVIQSSERTRSYWPTQFDMYLINTITGTETAPPLADFCVGIPAINLGIPLVPPAIHIT